MKVLLGIIIIFQGFLHSSEHDPIPDIYRDVQNIYSPSESDYQYIQSRLSTISRPIIERMKDTAFIMKNFKLIGDGACQKPEVGFRAVNCSENEREDCIILYSSFNRNYPKGVKRLVEAISNSTFKGHVHYRIGGWPNTEEGDVVLSGVPFAFKVCFFREMKRYGYKRVLWLDASILPWTDLNYIFQLITDRGLFVQRNTHTVGIFMHEDSCNYFGISMYQCNQILSCSAAIIGIDFTDKNAASVIDDWYEAAKDPYAFFTPRSDQSALSLILYKRKLAHKMWPATTLGEPSNVSGETLFLMDRSYVKDIED